MAFNYKTIGNTAAAVVSLLAVGTALWFNRTPGPIDSPRPQDEAEIMTAILERHYAMGRVVWYGASHPEITATIFVTNAPAVLATGDVSLASGYYSLFEQGSGRQVDWKPSRMHPRTAAGIFVYDEVGANDFTVEVVGTNFVGRFIGDPGPYYTIAYWYGSGTNLPQWLAPDENGFGAIYLYQAPTGAMAGVRGVITNATAYTTTNTVGRFPNATRVFPFGIRTAFIGRNIANHFYGWTSAKTNRLDEWYTLVGSPPSQNMYPYQLVAPTGASVPGGDGDILGPDNRSTGWIVPEDAYMDSGDLSWFGSVVHSNVFGAPNQFWYQWDSLYDAIYGTNWFGFANKWQERQQKVWTTYISRATATWKTTTNYHASVISTSVVSGVTNVITNTLWSSTNYVNTAPYNTWISTGPWSSLGRECATMILPFERDGIRTNRVDPSAYIGDLEKPIEPRPSYWSTNVYNDMARPLSMLQWIRDYRQPTTNIYWSVEYRDDTLYSSGSTTGFSVAYPSAGSSYRTRPTPPRKISRAWGTTVLYNFVNPIPFTVDNVLFQQTARVNTNCPTAWDAGPTSITSVAVGALGSSGWWPIDPDAMRTFVDDFARTNNDANNIITFSMDIPYDCYHVQFSALTNYLNHVPAR